MTKNDLIIFKKNTDAISTNQGFYYQYLTTLKVWVSNYIAKEQIDIYCETEDDIFQINKSESKVSFTQVKCYAEGFSLRDTEILKSLINFFFLHLKYKDNFTGQYIFETNAGTKQRAGKFLKDWASNQEDSTYVINNCVDELKKNLQSFIEIEINNKIQKIKDKTVISSYSKFKSDFLNEINSNSFNDFIIKIRWNFLEKESKSAINEHISEINELINQLKQSIPLNLVFARLLSEILKRSSEKSIQNRILNSDVLNNILKESDDIMKLNLQNEVSLLMETNFLILNEIDIVKNMIAKSLNILKSIFNDEFSFEEFTEKYKESATEKLTRVDFFALNTPQGIMKNQKIRLNEIYVKPTFLIKKQKANQQRIAQDPHLRVQETLTSYSDLFQVKCNLIILGGPGAGKSILSKSIISGILSKNDTEFSNKDIFYYLPFRIELRKYLASKKENRDNIPKYLKRILEDEYYISKLTVRHVESIMENYPTLFIFDGLDEIFDTTNKSEIVEDIEIFTKSYKKVKTIVTSRIVGYDEAKLSESFSEIYFQPFNHNQIKEYLDKWYTQHLPGSENDKSRKDEINLFLSQKDQIDEELLTNPLLLSLIVILFSNNLKIPNSKLAIYENCTNTLVDKWDNSKQLKIEISPELLRYKETIFADLAYWQYVQTSIRLESNQKDEITHSDAVETVRLTIMDKLKLIDDYATATHWARNFLSYAEKRSLYFDNEFTHKTFREYYTAFWIYTNLDRKHKTQERDSVIAKYISNPFWHIVLELLINMIDEKQPDNEIIDELIKNQISTNDHSMPFVLNIFPKLKHVSKSTISDVIMECIQKAILSYKKEITDNSLPIKIADEISSLLSDNFYFNLVNESIIKVYPLVKDNESKLESYMIFFSELEIFPRYKSDFLKRFNLTYESQAVIEKNSYLYFLIKFKDSFTFDQLIRFVELFGASSIFIDFPMFYRSNAMWSCLYTRYLIWQLNEIESIENNLNTILKYNIIKEKLFQFHLPFFHLKVDYERIINHLQNITNNDAKALVLFLLITDGDGRDTKHFSLEKFNSITMNNMLKEILEYLIFSKAPFNNKIKKIEEFTGMVIQSKELKK